MHTHYFTSHLTPTLAALTLSSPLSLHLGNYLGSISQWPLMQADYDCSFCVVDLHSLTNMPKNLEVTKELKENTLTAAAIYIAAGVDPEKR